MITKTRKKAGRITALVLVLLLTLTALTGCFGSSSTSKTLTVNKNMFVVTDNAELERHGLSMTELNAVADLLAAVCGSDFDTQEMLVAANRGYNMTVEGFDLTADRPYIGPSVEAAIDVINAANAKASDSQKIAVDLSRLNAADLQTLVDSLKSSVNTESENGFFDTILTWIGKALSWITNTIGFGSYLIGICIFAVLIEICMLPFDIRQQKNSIRQAKLRPKEMAIRNKYKGRNDQPTMQKMQQEIQEFYQKENFSPYSGCLPLLIQLPIIMALYNIVMNPLRYVLGQATGISSALSTYYTAAKAAGGMGATIASSSSSNTITLLAAIKEQGIEILDGLKHFEFFSNSESVFSNLNAVADSIPNFSLGGINLGLNPDLARFDILLLVPILTFAAYFLTAKLNRKFMAQPASNGGVEDKQVACSNSMMDITMPLMSTFFTFMVPALVGIYWIFRSLIGLLKRFIMSKVMPLPVFTEDDYKAAAKEMAGKRSVQKSERVGKLRSLHHIDDEDFEDTRERGLARKAALEEENKKEQTEKQKKTPFEASPLKEVREEERKEVGKKKSKADPAAEQADEVSVSSEETENKNNLEK